MKYPVNYFTKIAYNLLFITITFNKTILSQDVPENCSNIDIIKDPKISLDVNEKNFIMAKLKWTDYKNSIAHDIQIYSYPCKNQESKGDFLNINYKNNFSEIIYSPNDNSHIFLSHNCNYTFVIEQDFKCLQKIDFHVPVCVKNNCCDPTRSPVQVLKINPVKQQQNLYNVTFNITEKKLNLSSIFYVYRKNNSKKSIRVKVHSNFTNNGNFQLIEFEYKENYTLWLKYDNGSCQAWSKYYYKEGENKSVFVIFIIILCILVIVPLLFILIYRKSVWNCLKNVVFFASTEPKDVSLPLHMKWASNVIYSTRNNTIVYENQDKFEIERQQVSFGRKIGEGTFGVVYAGYISLRTKEEKQIVAIKLLKENASEECLNEFILEINLMKRIGDHDHIVKFMGCCTEKRPYLILMEFLDCGNLKTYLENLRKDWELKKAELKNTQPNIFFPDSMVFPLESDISYTCMTPSISPASPVSLEESSLSPLLYNNQRQRLFTDKSTTTTTTYVLSSTPNNILKPELSEEELHSFALQIARGMEYLESIKVTHRDLAARNILISKDKKLKISDFGFSRVGPYTSTAKKIIPMRWMSIEAIERGRCDNKSDVWSYGVVLWEIGTLGAFPYETIADYLILPQLKKGVRLKRPQVSSDKLYDLMMNCWLENPEERPNFSEVVMILSIEQMPYNLSMLDKDYVFPSLNYVQIESNEE